MIKKIFAVEKKSRKGLMAVEWIMLAYTIFTTLFILVTWVRLAHPVDMLWFRAQSVILTLALLLLLSWWYPDTYELNRIFPNLDHLFAGYEQSLFGFQPALTFCQTFSHPIFSELMAMGYVSYYLLFVGIVFFYFFCRYEHFERTAFIVVGSFFLFYLIFDFLPVAGPQFYFKAVGVDQIAQGIFPNIGDYFNTIQFDVPAHSWLGRRYDAQAADYGPRRRRAPHGRFPQQSCGCGHDSDVAGMGNKKQEGAVHLPAFCRAAVLQHLLHPGPLRHRRHCRPLLRHRILLLFKVGI